MKNQDQIIDAVLLEEKIQKKLYNFNGAKELAWA